MVTYMLSAMLKIPTKYYAARRIESDIELRVVAVEGKLLRGAGQDRIVLKGIVGACQEKDGMWIGVFSASPRTLTSP